MVNQKGGVNKHKIALVSLDDAFSAGEDRRSDAPDGRAGRRAVHLHVGRHGGADSGAEISGVKEDAARFLSTGASKWNDPKEFPWTTPILHLYSTEGEIHAKYLLEQKPNAKIAILMQNDDFGKDFVAGSSAVWVIRRNR